ncbi:MAG: hypothetical protein ACTTI6_02555 [Treponema sp.]|uniref:hypothetical protein n=1 Tax=Treponema sp. TaxID=166 RepID=UPI003FA2CC17
MSNEKTVQRVIKFDVLEWTKQGKAADIEAIFNSISALSWDTGERYYRTAEGHEIAIFIDHLSYPIRGQLATIRRTELPGTETLGERAPLYLQNKTGLCEPSHFIIYKNKQNTPIIAYEYNIYAPRISRLGEYVRIKFPEQLDVPLSIPIASEDIKKELAKIGKVKKLTLKAYSGCSFASLNGSINKAFSAMKQALKGELIEFTVSASRAKDSILKMPKNENIIQFMSSSDAHIFLQNFKIEYKDKETKERKESDLMNLFLREKTEVQKVDERSRMIDRDAMYHALANAIDKHRAFLDGVSHGTAYTNV